MTRTDRIPPATSIAKHSRRSGGADLADDIAALTGATEAVGPHPRNTFLKAVLKRINDIEKF